MVKEWSVAIWPVDSSSTKSRNLDGNSTTYFIVGFHCIWETDCKQRYLFFDYTLQNCYCLQLQFSVWFAILLMSCNTFFLHLDVKLIILGCLHPHILPLLLYKDVCELICNLYVMNELICNFLCKVVGTYYSIHSSKSHKQASL